MLDIRKERLGDKDLVELNTYLHNGHPDDQRDCAAKYAPQVRSEVESRTRDRDDLVGEFQESKARDTGKVYDGRPVKSLDDEKTSRFYFKQGAFLSPVEVILGALLGLIYASKKLGSWRIAIGAGAALVAMWVCRGVAKAVLFKADIPAPSRERLKRYVGLLTSAVIFAIGLFLGLRFIDFGRRVLLDVATWILSLALPFLAALYFELSDSYRKLNDLAKAFDESERRLAFAQAILDRIETLLAGTPAPVPPAGALELPKPERGEPFGETKQPVPATGPSHIPATLLLILALLLGMTPLGITPLYACSPVTVKLSLDNSGSGNIHALELVRSKLPGQILKLPCALSVEVQGFATLNEVLAGAPKVMTIPKKGKIDREKVCGEIDEATVIFEDESRSHEAGCDAKIQRIKEEEIRKHLQQLSNALRSIDFTRKATQSCVYQAISKALAEPRSVVPIVISDLKHEACPFSSGPITPLFGAPPGAQPIIIVVPSSGDGDPIAAMNRRMREVGLRAPGVRLVPYTQIDRLF